MGNPHWPRRLLRAALGLLALLALAWLLLRYGHVDNRLLRWARDLHPGSEWNQPHWQQASLWLPGYAFDGPARHLDVEDNLSGLDHDEEHDRLLAVINRPAQLLVLDRRGEILRRHRVRGASDVEAVCWLGQGQVALLQEGRRSMLVATLPERDGQPILAAQARRIPLDMPDAGNNGPEGMAYDAREDVLYIAKERKPTALYALEGVLAGGPVRQRDRSDWLRSLAFATDLSSLEFDPVTRHLLLLSDESQLIAEITLDGRPVSTRSLHRDGWQLPVPQAEGIAVDAQGTLYLVSEPNLFYRLLPTSGGRGAARLGSR